MVEGSWQTSSQISLYLRKDLPEQSILDMKQRILLYPEVESVTYMNRDEALKESARSPLRDALDYLDSNPLPPVLSVIPDPRWQNPEGPPSCSPSWRMSPASNRASWICSG